MSDTASSVGNRTPWIYSSRGGQLQVMNLLMNMDKRIGADVEPDFEPDFEQGLEELSSLATE